MQTESAVSFPTPTRIHLGLPTRDVTKATSFYSALFGQEPTKVRDGYVKFEVFDPPVILSLNQTEEPIEITMPQHFGIQVQRHKAIPEFAKRLAAAGYAEQSETQVTCCHAVQDKIWATDPDGHMWELYIVTKADTVEHSIGRVGPAMSEPSACNASADASEQASAEAEAPCCPPTCCQ